MSDTQYGTHHPKEMIANDCAACVVFVLQDGPLYPTEVRAKLCRAGLPEAGVRSAFGRLWGNGTLNVDRELRLYLTGNTSHVA